jgi:hypothetical protein
VCTAAGSERVVWVVESSYDPEIMAAVGGEKGQFLQVKDNQWTGELSELAMESCGY